MLKNLTNHQIKITLSIFLIKQNKEPNMSVHPIKGYHLEKTIRYTIFFQIATTLYILVRTIITGQSAFIYYSHSMDMKIYLLLILLQCVVSLYLLNSQGKNPNYWKACFLLLSTIFISSIKIKSHSYSIVLDIIGVLLVLSCISVIITTHNYLKKIEKAS